MRQGTALLAALIITLGTATSAHAAGGTEFFEAYADGTVMQEQVAGLKFGTPLPPGVTVAGGARPLVVREDADARSGTKVAKFGSCGRGCLAPRTFVHFAGPWPTTVRTWAGSDGTSSLARMRAYDGRGRLIGETGPQRVLTAKHETELVVSTAEHIAYVEIVQEEDPRAANGTPVLSIDDFTWNDPTFPLPDFDVTVASTTKGPGALDGPARIRANRSFEWTVEVDEGGGAYGKRRWSLTGVPDPERDQAVGVVTSIDGQDEGVVTDDVELTVRVTVLEDLVRNPSGPTQAQDFDLALVGEPVDPRAGTVAVNRPLGTLQVLPNVIDKGPRPRFAFGRCGASVLDDTYRVGIPFSGAGGLEAPVSPRFKVTPVVNMTQEASAAGLSFVAGPEQAVLDPQTGAFNTTLRVRAERTKPITKEIRVPVFLDVRDADFKSVGAEAAPTEIIVEPDVGAGFRVDGLTPKQASTPQLLRPGTEVVLEGGPFCPGAQVMFNNEQAVVPAEPRDNGTQLVARVPRLATTGPVTVLQGGLKTAGPVLTVDSFRNTGAYPFANPKLKDLEFQDTVNLYGYEATHVDSLDEAASFACEFFSLTLGDCDVEVGARDPQALIHHAIVDYALSGGPNDAHCFGMAVSSRQLAAGKVPLSKYGAKQVFDIAGPGGLKAGSIRRYLRAQHGAQLSLEFISEFLDYFLGAQIDKTTEVVDRFKSLMNAGKAPVVAMGQGGGGHVVVAYDLEQIGPNDWWVYVADPNDPYVGKGDTADPKDGFIEEDFSGGGSHKQRVEANRIRLGPDNRWSYAPLKYGPGKYQDLSHRLMVFDGAAQKVRPTLPASLKGLAHIAFGATAETTSAGGRGSVPFGSFEGRELSAEVFTAGKKPVTRTIRPRRTRGGRYGSYVAGQGFAATLAAEGATPAERDRLVLDPAGGRVQLTSTAASRRFGMIAAREAAKGSRGLRVVGRTAKGAVTSVRIDKAGVATVRAGASTALRLTLLAGRKGDGSVRKLPALSVRRGSVVRIDPSSWTDLRRPVTVKVKQPGKGTVTKRLKAVRR